MSKTTMMVSLFSFNKTFKANAELLKKYVLLSNF